MTCKVRGGKQDKYYLPSLPKVMAYVRLGGGLSVLCFCVTLCHVNPGEAFILLTLDAIEAEKILEASGSKPSHYREKVEKSLCSCQNLHSLFMTTTGKRPGILNLWASLSIPYS